MMEINFGLTNSTISFIKRQYLLMKRSILIPFLKMNMYLPMLRIYYIIIDNNQWY